MKRWLLLLILVPVLGWSAYWAAAAFGMKHGLETTLSGQRFEGLSGQAQESHVSGFPSQFRFGVMDLELHQAAVFSASIPQVQIEASAYSPHQINLELDSPQRVTTAFGDTVVDADLFQIGIFLRPNLSIPLDRILLRLENAEMSVASQEERVRADRLAMDFLETPESQSGETEGLYRLRVVGEEIDLSDLLSDFPDDYRSISDVRADIGLVFSSLWDRSTFNTGFPRLQNVIIPEVQLAVGPSQISLEGQVSVGLQGEITGNVILNISSWRGLLAAFTQAEIVHQDLAEIILDIMDGQDENDTVNLPLKIDNNLVSFGVFTLGFLPTP